MLRDFRASLKLPRGALAAALATIGLATPIRPQPPRAACLARHYAAYAGAQRDYQRTVERPANQWLDWGRAEAERLARIDTAFARLDSVARVAGRSLSGHPRWGALRDAVRGRVQTEPEHRAALERLTAAMNAKPGCG